MHDRHSHIFDVVIAGGGPVGLFLACELRLAGLAVLVLEQAAHPRSPLKRLPFGMRGLSATSLEALYRRGLLAEVLAAQRAGDTPGNATTAAHWLQQPRRPAGHFAGIQFYADDVDLSRWRYRLPAAVGTSLMVTLETFETVLAARARRMGADIRYGISVEDFDASAEEVMIRAASACFRGRWLVGCDGAHSGVRKKGGFGFKGTDPEFTGYSVEADLADPDTLQPGRHYTSAGMYTYARPGTITVADFDGGAFHRTQPITLEHVQTVLRRVSDTDVTLSALRLATTWTDRAYQTTAYRKGRVLLAGDAAHIHAPLGGQGLNLGLGDAMNLGWKLAATVLGSAPDELLDSYETERKPVGAQVLDWSRAQVVIMRPTRSTRALEAIMRDLISTRDGATYFAERVWGTSLKYDLASSHPLVGCSVPDFVLSDGKKAGELLREGKGLLLDFSSRQSLQALASCWSGRITYVAHDSQDQLGVDAVLVRPDGSVAWVDEDCFDEDGAMRAMLRWFGKPAHA